jgi:hypothetical protein
LRIFFFNFIIVTAESSEEWKRDEDGVGTLDENGMRVVQHFEEKIKLSIQFFN